MVMCSSNSSSLGCCSRRSITIAATSIEQMLLFVGISVIAIGPALVGVAVVAAATTSTASSTMIELQVCPNGPKATKREAPTAKPLRWEQIRV